MGRERPRMQAVEVGEVPIKVPEVTPRKVDRPRPPPEGPADPRRPTVALEPIRANRRP